MDYSRLDQTSLPLAPVEQLGSPEDLLEGTVSPQRRLTVHSHTLLAGLDPEPSPQACGETSPVGPLETCASVTAQGTDRSCPLRRPRGPVLQKFSREPEESTRFMCESPDSSTDEKPFTYSASKIKPTCRAVWLVGLIGFS